MDVIDSVAQKEEVRITLGWVLMAVVVMEVKYPEFPSRDRSI